MSKKPALLSVSSVLERSLRLALVDTTTDVLEVLFFSTSSMLLQVLKVRNVENIRWCAYCTEISRSAQALSLFDHANVESLHTLVREGRRGA